MCPYWRWLLVVGNAPWTPSVGTAGAKRNVRVRGNDQRQLDRALVPVPSCRQQQCVLDGRAERTCGRCSRSRGSRTWLRPSVCCTKVYTPQTSTITHAQSKPVVQPLPQSEAQLRSNAVQRRSIACSLRHYAVAAPLFQLVARWHGMGRGECSAFARASHVVRAHFVAGGESECCDRCVSGMTVPRSTAATARKDPVAAPALVSCA